MSFSIKILGSNAAAPAHGRHQSAQVLSYKSKKYLIDCGEGSQIRLQNFKVKTNKIEQIFISHLHGDHFFGLIGLLSTMHLMGRKVDIDLFGPKGLEDIIILNLKYSETILKYTIHFHEVDTKKAEQIFENEDITVSTIPLSHRIPCAGFLFKEKEKPYRIRKEKLPKEIKLEDIVQFKKGKDVIDEEGNIKYRLKDYTSPPDKPIHYAYCSDSKYLESTIEYVKDVDILYHESTFLDDMRNRAEDTFHATAKQAAEIALKANAKKLILGHFSSRYKSLEGFLDEAKSIFPNTVLAIEGEDITSD